MCSGACLPGSVARVAASVMQTMQQRRVDLRRLPACHSGVQHKLLIEWVLSAVIIRWKFLLAEDTGHVWRIYDSETLMWQQWGLVQTGDHDWQAAPQTLCWSLGGQLAGPCCAAATRWHAWALQVLHHTISRWPGGQP